MSPPITRPAHSEHILPQDSARVDGRDVVRSPGAARVVTDGGSHRDFAGASARGIGASDHGLWGVVVPAGGGGSRLGGADKPGLQLSGRSLLERLVDSLPRDVPVAVVGPDRELRLERDRPVLWCREDPPGGGPAAAVGAGLAALEDDDAAGRLAVVVVLPGDAPFSALAVPRLLAALDAAPQAQAAVAVDGSGRRQMLLAAQRRTALAARVAALRARDGGLAGLAAARLLPSDGDLVEVTVPDTVLADVDLPGDLERLASLAAELPGHPDQLDRPDQLDQLGQAPGSAPA
ncbi:Molybdopterin-guanine dinucleotide biosynthesis protein A [Quadrisphaera granulorum]|uniref:Molybdopterin-guanine dinucleotide biosynthesis protein A n=1 Tax=Quadrisphaera granulorum TaxID=317664 RepID=A0A316AE83_9ACTN|nr:NTP transferase domain-containing protein [Quadrisphaera granulorum]PWJ55669.1 molybdopterin-guanine dinucleotide biosynthesis protein A [Quadrisphaera granulorum]SZE95166.1 Molybdopterin-guanine dinucleotide biosynthesis protein A [Quadrisphaera granulorum]